MFYFGDFTYLMLIPALILTLYAQFKVNSTFQELSRVRSKVGLTGAEIARRLLDRNNLGDVRIEQIGGRLSDHYDPRSRVLRLSPQVYGSSSLASLGIAAHETGHAIQHDNGYIPLKIRHTILPVANFGSTAGIYLFVFGLLFRSPSLMDLGIIAFTAVVLFQLVTLPVEFNASSRAIKMLVANGYLEQDEIPETKKVLDAAALTYVAAAAMGIMQLLRLLMLRDRRN
ncbi:MAG TPA: zinc metallopeptidase [Clostridia bacterium]|nr:zinc metallopeptidase [Clostridia bacterium]